MGKNYDLGRRDEDIEERVIEGIAKGDSMAESAKTLGLEKTFLFPKYRRLYQDFDEACRNGMEAYCNKLEEDLKTIYQRYDEKTATGMTKNIIKLLEFYDPKKYSPKQQHDITMQLPDIGRALDEAEKRVLESSKIVDISIKKKEKSTVD